MYFACWHKAIHQHDLIDFETEIVAYKNRLQRSIVVELSSSGIIIVLTTPL